MNQSLGVAGVSDVELAARLAAVGTLGETKREKTKRLIPVVDRRLTVWGEWQLNNRESSSGETAGSTMLGALIDGRGLIVRSTNPCAGSMPDDIYDTDKAVSRLADPLQRAVHVAYTELVATAVQKAEMAGCSVMTFYRRLERAHQEILFLLKTPEKLEVRYDKSKAKSKRARKTIDAHDNPALKCS